MHYGCLGGHVEAIHLLLEKKGDVTLKNTYDHTALDLAIDNLHHDVVIAMLRTKRRVDFDLLVFAGADTYCFFREGGGSLAMRKC